MKWRAGGAFALGLSLLGGRALQAQSAYEQLQMLSDALNLVRGNYVDSVAYSHLARAAINGILRSLDPHSYFMSSGDFSHLNALEAGKLTSAGLSLTEAQGRMIVLSVAPRGPAERAGVSAGDRLLAVNDTPTAGSRAAEVEVRLSSAQRRRLTLLFERGASLSPDTFRISLRTEETRDLSVIDQRVLPSGIGYLRLAEFGAKAGAEVEDAVKKLRSQRARGIIIDLRNNPGGRVTSAVDVAQLFLREKTVVFRTDGRKADADKEYVAKRTGPFLDEPLALLVDRGTASAAEALAGALQDHKRARVVGRRTYGKALVQAPFFLKTGDVMWMTIARAISPSGRLIQREYTSLAPEAYRALAREDTTKGGIIPDVAVASVELPPWWTRAAASGLVLTVADSVGAALPNSTEARNAWLAGADDWDRRLLRPFLAKLPTTSVSDANVSAQARNVLASLLAARAAEVRWGLDAATDLLLSRDPDVRAAEVALGGSAPSRR
jgi:carboxyl-terminal processing protease